jgi:hypothetical protein
MLLPDYLVERAGAKAIRQRRVRRHFLGWGTRGQFVGEQVGHPSKQ